MENINDFGLFFSCFGMLVLLLLVAVKLYIWYRIVSWLWRKQIVQILIQVVLIAVVLLAIALFLFS